MSLRRTIRWLRRRKAMAAAAAVSLLLVLMSSSLWVRTPVATMPRFCRSRAAAAAASHHEAEGDSGRVVTLQFPTSAGLNVSSQYERTELDMARRRSHYEKVCDRQSHSGGVAGMVQNPLVYLPANLSLCWVPKVACTFWLRVFFFLHHDTDRLPGPRPVTSPFAIDRVFVHFDGGRVTKDLPFNDAHNRDVIWGTRRVMFARDPWSRLWSGYIDKIVLPDSWLDHGRRILRQRELSVGAGSGPPTGTDHQDSVFSTTLQSAKAPCANDVTFEEFVGYVLRSSPDRHWSPLHLTCNPCLFRPQLVGKMETFARDAAYVLNASGLGEVVAEEDLAHLSHVRDEVKLLIDYHFRLWERRKELHLCLDLKGLASRLWKAFQLNGYLSPDAIFPAKAVQNVLVEETFETFASFLPEPALTHSSSALLEARDRFTDVVLASVMSSASLYSVEELWSLRRRNMVEAYRRLPQRLINSVRDRFMLDFQLFGYDPEPNDIFIRQERR